MKVADVSLDHFRQQETVQDRGPPESWPYLGICPDQGPDGLCATKFMAYRNSIICEPFFDISHGVWNDQMRATSAVGLQSSVHLMVITHIGGCQANVWLEAHAS